MILFEWDEAKQAANLAKHGIDFEDIGPAFLDPDAMEMADARQDYGEERRIRIARCKGVVLVIVFTLRGPNIRLISARRANERERAIHER
jgi:uncharacterized DUF497 family protein